MDQDSSQALKVTLVGHQMGVTIRDAEGKEIPLPQAEVPQEGSYAWASARSTFYPAHAFDPNFRKEV